MCIRDRLLTLLIAVTMVPGAATAARAQAVPGKVNFSVGAQAQATVVPGVPAREPPTGRETRLTLEEAQARAIEASHRLAESRARQRVADAVVDARVAAQRPSIVASVSYTHLTLPTSD